MKVILLAGGFGTRLSEYTGSIPKPMVQIGGKPILWHIMETYAHYGFKDFYVALGYKSEYVKSYFLNYPMLNSDFSVNLATGNVKQHNAENKDWDITLIDTGLSTMTGGRIKRLQSYIGEETFMMTYGDGLGDINMNQLLDFHKSHGKLVTVSAVRPSARFGELQLEGKRVIKFAEKPQLSAGRINGGFFVMEPEFFSYIDGDDILLERQPLERAADDGELMAYKHDGFWYCMDTKRDLEVLEKMWDSGAPWKKKNKAY